MSVDLAQLGKVIATLKHPCTAEVFFFWLPNTLGAGRPRSVVKASSPYGKHEVFGWVAELKEYATAAEFAADNFEGAVEASAYEGELPIRICRATVIASDPPGAAVRAHYRVSRPTAREWGSLWANHSERMRALAIPEGAPASEELADDETGE
jgi:hypothetical protein